MVARIVLVVMSLMLSLISFSSLANGEIRGALCAIKADNKIVLVNEILTKKLSLPGGTIDAGERPQDAAQRETWEETGLVVTVGPELGRTETVVVYDCVSDSDVIAFDFHNAMDGNELPVWFAPDYGIEISSAMLISPNELTSDQYRYPEQWDQVVGFFGNATNQSVTYLDHLIEGAPFFNQVELHWIAALQYWVGTLPDGVSSAIKGFLLLGNQLALPWLTLVLFPLLYWKFGKDFSYKAFFAVAVTSLLCLIGQQGFALPRPHVYLPIIELTHSYGFSLPSLPFAVWSSVATLVFHRMGKLSINKLTLAFGAAMVWMGLAKFYSGSAFILDMFAGVVVGSLTTWHIIRLKLKPELDVQALLTSRGVWFFLTAVCAVLSVFWPIPIFTAWLAILVTVSGLILTLDRNREIASGQAVVTIIAALLLLNLGISYLATFVSTSSMYSLIVEVARYPVLILVYTLFVRQKPSS